HAGRRLRVGGSTPGRVCTASVFDRSPRALRSRGPLPRTDWWPANGGWARAADVSRVGVLLVIFLARGVVTRWFVDSFCASGRRRATERRPSRAKVAHQPKVLAAQAQLVGDRAAPLDVDLGQVGEQPLALADQDQQAPTAVVVMLVDLQVLGELVDAPSQQRDLHLGRPRIALLGAELPNDLSLGGLVERHDLPLDLERVVVSV